MQRTYLIGLPESNLYQCKQVPEILRKAIVMQNWPEDRLSCSRSSPYRTILTLVVSEEASHMPVHRELICRQSTLITNQCSLSDTYRVVEGSPLRAQALLIFNEHVGRLPALFDHHKLTFTGLSRSSRAPPVRKCGSPRHASGSSSRHQALSGFDLDLDLLVARRLSHNDPGFAQETMLHIFATLSEEVTQRLKTHYDVSSSPLKDSIQDILRLPGEDCQTVDTMIHFLYTGKYETRQRNGAYHRCFDHKAVYALADKLQLRSLQTRIYHETRMDARYRQHLDRSPEPPYRSWKCEWRRMLHGTVRPDRGETLCRQPVRNTPPWASATQVDFP